MKERIQKLLAEAGVESRRHVEDMVLAGRIAVNGNVVWTLPVMVDPDVDRVEIDGERVQLSRRIARERVYIIMNKPKGVYCTNVAQGEQRRAIDLLPPEFNHRVYPVGRLDADSRGLLLLTNDGDLTQQLTHPKFGVVKTYTCVVDGFVKPETIEQLSKGVWLADPTKGGFKTNRSYIKMIKRSGKNSVLQITIKEGRNRQVRRMLLKVGHKVRELTRVKIGPLELGSLKPGESRPLTPRELETLRKAIKPHEHGAAPAGAPAPRTGAAGRSGAPRRELSRPARDNDDDDARPAKPARPAAERRPERTAHSDRGRGGRSRRGSNRAKRA
jgi:pseudouridine synthase